MRHMTKLITLTAMLTLSGTAFADAVTSAGTFGCDIDEATGKATRMIQVAADGKTVVSSKSLITEAAVTAAPAANMTSIMDEPAAKTEGGLRALPAAPSYIPEAEVAAAPKPAMEVLPSSCPPGTKLAADKLSCMATSGYTY